MAAVILSFLISSMYSSVTSSVCEFYEISVSQYGFTKRNKTKIALHLYFSQLSLFTFLLSLKSIKKLTHRFFLLENCFKTPPKVRKVNPSKNLFAAVVFRSLNTKFIRASFPLYNSFPPKAWKRIFKKYLTRVLHSFNMNIFELP